MSTDSTKASLYGIARGLIVHALIYPLDVVKIHQQCSPIPTKSFEIARAVFQKGGIGAFYKGLSPQLVKTSIKQAWVWPIITGLPIHLRQYNIGKISELILTGLTIAIIDAAVTTPLEKSKIQSAFTGKEKFSLKNGWQGSTTHLAKLSITWPTFLITQKQLRDHYQQKQEQALSLPQLAKIGAQTAVIGSLASAPLDIANTLKQAQNRSPTHLLSMGALRKLYRGWPLHALALSIHSVASVIVIDRLDPNVSLKE